MAKKNRPLGRGVLGKTPRALRPKSRKRIVRQATRLMKKVYRPALAELNTEERKAKALAEKRKADNEYYRNWLISQTEQLRAHAEAADQQLLQHQAQIQQDAANANQQLRQQLVQAAQQQIGGVSNPEQAKAFDITPEAEHGQALIAAERTRTAQAVGSRSEAADARAASNFAMAAANEYRRQADLSNALKEIAGAKQKVRLERAAKTAEEVARLLDQEIAKAQSRVDMRNIAAQVALDLKNFRLAKRNYKLNKRVQLGELALARREQRETERHNRATERIAQQRERRLRRKDRRDSRKDRRDDRQERRERQRQIRHIINNTISAVTANRKWRKLGRKNKNELVKKLVNRGVAEPVFARASVELIYDGKLSPSSQRALRNLGFKIPKGWLR